MLLKMGIDIVCLESIMKSLEHIKVENRIFLLTLGRKEIDISEYIFNIILHKYKTNILDYHTAYCQQFFSRLGFQRVDSIDDSSCENDVIIHNMNKKIPERYHNMYSYIYDGGTTDHIFNNPQKYDNIINLLYIGGIVCSIRPNNNFSGHGIYQFSPELFLSMFTPKYGMEIIGIYLGKYIHHLNNG